MNEESRIHYLKQLNHPETEVRRQAILKLGQTDDSHIFKILSSHFSDGHPAIREALLRIFSANKSRRVAEIVVDTLHSPQLSVQSLAMEILKSMEQEAILPLRRLTKSGNPEIRKIAIELLGDINHSSAAGILLDLLDESDEEVLLAVIEGLGKQKEIRAVPRLLEYYDINEKHKSTILNALTQIFLYWEKNIVRSEILDDDPILAASFINSVQENGNVSSLNLILQWLKNENLGSREELVKALAAILDKNAYITLPVHLFNDIKLIWQQHFESMPLSSYLICLCRIPSVEALDEILEFYEKNPADKIIQTFLAEYLSRFFSIYLARLSHIESNLHLKILNLLLERKTPISDKQLLDVQEASDNPEEKRLLMRLAVNSNLPEAKQMLLARLSGNSNAEVAETLKYLLKYREEELWPLYFKYLDHKQPELKAVALQGLLQFPEKTLDYILINLKSTKAKSLSFFFNLVMALPPGLADRFFMKWLADGEEDKVKSLGLYIIKNMKTEYLPLIVKNLREYPEQVNLLLSSISKTIDEFQMADSLNGYWQTLPESLQSETERMFTNFWGEGFETQYATADSVEQFSDANPGSDI